MSLGLGQSREIAFVLAKTRASVWSPSVYTDFNVHHQRAAAAPNQRRACVLQKVAGTAGHSSFFWANPGMSRV